MFMKKLNKRGSKFIPPLPLPALEPALFEEAGVAPAPAEPAAGEGVTPAPEAPWAANIKGAVSGRSKKVVDNMPNAGFLIPPLTKDCVAASSVAWSRP